MEGTSPIDTRRGKPLRVQHEGSGVAIDFFHKYSCRLSIIAL